MKYIVYWILSWTAYVECPPQVDEFGRIQYSHPNYSLSLGTQPCTEKKTKLMTKEFDDFELASRFLKRALDVKQKETSIDNWNMFSHQKIDTVWMITEEPVKELSFNSGTIIHFKIDTLTVGDSYYIKMKHEHNMACPKNCKEK